MKTAANSSLLHSFSICFTLSLLL
uniref:Uncharacterized protein n=1 Tax=Anguilla anguilla TaxID=7936 RepID=A0A0E9W0D6_ANGAN